MKTAAFAAGLALVVASLTPASGASAVNVERGACAKSALTVVKHSEHRIATKRGTVWSLIQSEGRPGFTVGLLVKVVWRITGHGHVSVTARAPDGHTTALSFGPEGHGTSNWNRPGDEYGSGFVPDARGCWTMTIRRGPVEGALHMIVRA